MRFSIVSFRYLFSSRGPVRQSCPWLHANLKNMKERSALRVNVNPIVDDFADLRRGSHLRYLDLILVLIGLLYAYLVVAEIWNEGLGRATASLVAMYSGVSLLAFFGIFFVRRMWVRLMFHHGPALRQDRQYSISASEIQMESEAMTLGIRWNAFSRIIETRRSFLLFLSPAFGMVFPKRCLSTTEDIVEFRNFVRQNFKGKLKLSD